ncbi:DUF1735 domain-containing protein [Sphingobacterium sp. FBM7-1]|uniref:DUF1735 domain-containing protein n=1 Tax=Sphingobacterium sp. FBM7-1 TaxID=2886688 RepID=UPI001D0F50EF|nr:DUF1735 domain-containing protein [Sphingobacterium sp. FBM7-1]MCC2599912.1 DUF1735 domain-containing protein [Sphingobacterium sp. FBM7-1]
MKLVNILSALWCIVTLSSCGNNPIDIEDLSRFRSIYLVQANEGYGDHVLDINDEIQIIKFSVGVGGAKRIDREVQVQMEAYPDLIAEYNDENRTNYLPMPQGSYELESGYVTIASNARYSNALNVRLRTRDFIEPGVSYLLPVGIAQVDSDIPVNEKLKIAYLRITGSYPLGEEPPVKVWELRGRTFKDLFIVQGALSGLEVDLLQFWEYNNLTGVFNNDPVTGLGSGGWGVFDVTIPTPTTLIARDVNGVYSGVPGSIFEYPVNVANRTLAGLGVTGIGFNAYNIMSHSAHYNAIFAKTATGDLYIIRKEGTQWSNKLKIGEGFQIYTNMVAYQNGVLAVTQDGGLWFVAISESGELSEPQLVGSGWNIYSRLMVDGNDLLALETSSGILWRYKFDLRGIWNVRR